MKYPILFFSVLLAFCACRQEAPYDAAGTFDAETVTLSAAQPGLILSLSAREGDIVRKGDLLGTLDTTALHLQKLLLEKQGRTLRSGRPDVEKQVAGIRSQLDQARREKARLDALLRDHAVAQKEADDMQARVSLLESQLEASLSTLRNQAATVDGNSSAVDIQVAQVAYQLERCRVVAPTDGTVTGRYAQEGEMASAGRPLLKIADLDHVFLRAYFTSEQLASLSLGQEVTVVADYGADARVRYPGKVVWIASESEFTPKSIQTRSSRANLVYAVKVAVPNDGRLKIGMYGEVLL